MKLRGRVWLGLWLVLFLVVSLAIVARQRTALLTAGELNRLREERLALEAERADYVRRIREASSQRVLIPRVQTRLHLRMPSDSEYVNFEVPASGGPGR
jgi:beta-lactamase regulating signal transducer with metallopeptidase domain